MRPANLGILAADRLLDVLNGELVAGEPRAVEVDAHRHRRSPKIRTSAAPAAPTAAAVRSASVVGRIQRRQRARLDGDVDDRLRIRLDLRDDRLVDRVRQLAARADTLSRTSAGRGIGIALQREPHVDAARLRSALRRHQLDALDAGERILERFRHLRLDHFGRCAAIRDVDADDRLVDPRIFANRQPRVRDQADQQDDQRQDRREKTGRLMQISGSSMTVRWALA